MAGGRKHSSKSGWGSQDQDHGSESGPKGYEPCDLKWDGP